VFECMSMISKGISDIVWCEYENMLSWEGNLGRINSKWETINEEESFECVFLCIYIYIHVYIKYLLMKYGNLKWDLYTWKFITLKLCKLVRKIMKWMPIDQCCCFGRTRKIEHLRRVLRVCVLLK